jgi:citrate lyase subunit beta/citryl-CoA lyase
MWTQDISLCRTLLFLPASNPRAIEKARALAADMIILDLEDAVPEADKAAARDAAVAATQQGFGGRPVAIRINAVGSPHHGSDMLAARRSRADYVVLPKVETPRDIHDSKVVCERPIVTMIETARGVLDVAILANASAALIAGTNDLSAALRIPPGGDRRGLCVSLQRIVLAGRAAGIAVFDGVYNRLDDLAGLQAEAEEGRCFGFDGKSIIHPGQIDTVNRAFTPSDDELAAADALIAAATGGAQRHDGRMIEDLHVAQARLLVARARR